MEDQPTLAVVILVKIPQVNENSLDVTWLCECQIQATECCALDPLLGKARQFQLVEK
jgi:hypothetical protein